MVGSRGAALSTAACRSLFSVYRRGVGVRASVVGVRSAVRSGVAVPTLHRRGKGIAKGSEKNFTRQSMLPQRKLFSGSWQSFGAVRGIIRNATPDPLQPFLAAAGWPAGACRRSAYLSPLPRPWCVPNAPGVSVSLAPSLVAMAWNAGGATRPPCSEAERSGRSEAPMRSLHTLPAPHNRRKAPSRSPRESGGRAQGTGTAGHGPRPSFGIINPGARRAPPWKAPRRLERQAGVRYGVRLTASCDAGCAAPRGKTARRSDLHPIKALGVASPTTVSRGDFVRISQAANGASCRHENVTDNPGSTHGEPLGDTPEPREGQPSTSGGGSFRHE